VDSIIKLPYYDSIFIQMNIPVEVTIAHKKAELEKLSVLHQEKERNFDELVRTFEQFKLRYTNEVGKMQGELNRLNAELDNVRAKKLFYAHKMNQHTPEAETGVERSDNISNVEKNSSQVKYNTVQDLKEAKKVYRKIASLIHPDKAKDGDSHPFRTKLMAELNEAYGRKDIIKMKRILEEWQESPESILGDDTNAEFKRIHLAIGKIKRRILEIDMEISRIKTSEVYVLMVKVAEADKRGKDMLQEISNSLKDQIQEVKNKLLLRMYA